MKETGRYLLMIGVVFSLSIGVFSSALGTAKDWIYTFMVIIGFALGFIEVSDKNSKDFVFLAAALSVIYFGAERIILAWTDLQLIGSLLLGIFQSLMALLIPAAVAVGFRSVWSQVKSTN